MNKLRICIFAIAALGLVISGFALTTGITPGKDEPNSGVTHQGGSIAYIDPETGQLSSQSTEVNDLGQVNNNRIESNAQQAAEIAPVERVMDDGSVMVKLNGQYNKPLTIVLNEEGEPDTHYADDYHHDHQPHKH